MLATLIYSTENLNPLASQTTNRHLSLPLAIWLCYPFLWQSGYVSYLIIYVIVECGGWVTPKLDIFTEL